MIHAKKQKGDRMVNTMFTERRTVRRYKEAEIEQDKLEKVFEAAQWAPSWANTQCCELVAVKN
ncbi:MAG: nitroreductase family protein, partial [Desulfopila sp.]